MKQKSIHNPCPICQLPRGKGPYELAHGKCAEERAKTEGKKLAFPDSKPLNRLTVEAVEKGNRKRNAERYKNGKLPDFMYT